MLDGRLLYNLHGTLLSGR